MTRSQFDTVGLLARSPEPIVKAVECCTNLAKQQPLVSVTSRLNIEFADSNAPRGEFSKSAYDPIDFCTVLGLPRVIIPIKSIDYSQATELNY